MHSIIVSLVSFDSCIQQSTLGTSYLTLTTLVTVWWIWYLSSDNSESHLSIHLSIPVDITAIVTGDDLQVEMRCSLTHMLYDRYDAPAEQIEHKSDQIKSVIMHILVS